MAGVTLRTPKISERIMKKFEVLDDAISIGYQNWILGYMTSSIFPWFYVNKITTEGFGVDDPYNGFSHQLGPDKNSDSIKAITPDRVLFEVLGNKQPTELLRIRAAMFTKNQTGIDTKHHVPHVDRPKDDQPYKVMLYYVMDSDGTTGIFEGDELIGEVEPKKGRVLLMDGNVFHASQCPKKHDQRIVINYNYRI